MDLLRLWRLERPARQAESAPAPRVYLYVATWAGAALVLAALLGDTRLSLLDGPAELVALTVVIFVADSISVSIQHARSTELVTVIDVAVAVAILSLPPTMTVIAVFIAVLANHLILRRLSGLKALFNAAQHAVAAGVGAMVLIPLDNRTGAFTSELLVMSGLALLVYFAVTGLAMTGLFAILGEDHPVRAFFARAPLVAVTVFGNGIAGLLAYGILQTNPVLLPLLVSPIVAMQLAYRNTARSEFLLSEVKVERDRLDRVIAGASEGIVLLDAEGVVLVWNDAMESITGVGADEAVGRPAEELLTGNDGNNIPVDPSMPVRQGQNGSYEVALSGLGGVSDPPVVQMNHTLITDNKDVIGDVVLVRDLSRERAATSLKEDFVSRVSHELRTPLSPIRGYAQVLLSNGDRVPAEKRQEVLERIVERVGHLERLIEDLLLVSRISSGAVEDLDEVNTEPFDTASIVSRLVEWFERDHADRPFDLSVDEGLPDAFADSFRAGQIVTNLLSNACKYSEKGSPVAVRIEHVDGCVRIHVTDQGHGIARDQLEAVFDRFQRIDDPQRMKTGGIGLGLYISRHLADRMGGSLTATSRLGVGSTFTLELATTDQAASQPVPA
jgi:signal transduction histidine kinase